MRGNTNTGTPRATCFSSRLVEVHVGSGMWPGSMLLVMEGTFGVSKVAVFVHVGGLNTLGGWEGVNLLVCVRETNEPNKVEGTLDVDRGLWLAFLSWLSSNDCLYRGMNSWRKISWSSRRFDVALTTGKSECVVDGQIRCWITEKCYRWGK